MRARIPQSHRGSGRHAPVRGRGVNAVADAVGRQQRLLQLGSVGELAGGLIDEHCIAARPPSARRAVLRGADRASKPARSRSSPEECIAHPRQGDIAAYTACVTPLTSRNNPARAMSHERFRDSCRDLRCVRACPVRRPGSVCSCARGFGPRPTIWKRPAMLGYTPASDGAVLNKACASCPMARPRGTPPIFLVALRGMPSKRQCTPR